MDIDMSDAWRLPSNAVARIINFLHDDSDALRNFALVCRACLAPSRAHLFHSIRIPDREQCQALQAVLEGNPELIAFVKGLQLITGYGTNPETMGRSWVNRELLALPPALFANIVSLSIVVGDFSALRPRAKQLLWTQFPALQALQIELAYFDDLQDLELLLDGAPALRSLTMDASSVNTTTVYADNWAISPRPRPVLREFALEIPEHNPEVLRWFRAKCDFSELGALHLSDVTLEDVPCLGLLLRKSCARLRTLDLRFVDPEDEWKKVKHVDTAAFHRDHFSGAKLDYLEHLSLGSCAAWLPLLLGVLYRTRLTVVTLRGCWWEVARSKWDGFRSAVRRSKANLELRCSRNWPMHEETSRPFDGMVVYFIDLKKHVKVVPVEETE